MNRDDFIERQTREPVRGVAEKAAKAGRLLREAARDYAPVVFANSFGAEDMVLTDLIWGQGAEGSNDPDIAIFSLDTGRLPAETYELIARAERHYGRRLEIYYPERSSVESFVGAHGINGFHDSVEARKACCHARKVEPLKRALDGKKAWVTGLRATQSPTREALKPVTFDETFGLVKINPLADWSEQDVWTYLRERQVPYNALHDRDYPSIGCAPCTRAVRPGEDIRAGRWWWESPATKECGLHVVDGRLQRGAPASAKVSHGDTPAPRKVAA
jgi:phosphoadenosine phosphosulfate reductase